MAFEGKGLIESLPFGDQISTLLNLDNIMGEFGKTVNDNLKGFGWVRFH